jgi:hypothetical protein
MSKSKEDPRLALVDFIKPNGTPVKVNSFSASLEAAVALGWMPEKEFKAAAAVKASKPTPAKKK